MKGLTKEKWEELIKIYKKEKLTELEKTKWWQFKKRKMIQHICQNPEKSLKKWLEGTLSGKIFLLNNYGIE